MQYTHVFAYSYHSSVLFIEGGTQHHGEQENLSPGLFLSCHSQHAGTPFTHTPSCQLKVII